MSHGSNEGDASGKSGPSLPAPGSADIGIVAALSIEVGHFLDRMKRVRRLTGPAHTVLEGECEGRVVAMLVGGVGRAAASRATRLLLEGHRPRWVISAGFGGGLNPSFHRNDVVLADEVLDLEGNRFPLFPDLPSSAIHPSVRPGRLLTVDAIVRTAVEKAEFHARHQADVVDMETSAVATHCLDRASPLLSLRVISDEATVDLPPEVARLLNRSGSYQVGSALRSIWNRPSSLKDFWNLHERAQEAADRLAEVLVRTIGRLP